MTRLNVGPLRAMVRMARTPVINWISLGAGISAVSMWTGIGYAFIVPERPWAVFVGTIPGIVYGVLCLCHFKDWSKP